MWRFQWKEKGVIKLSSLFESPKGEVREEEEFNCGGGGSFDLLPNPPHADGVSEHISPPPYPFFLPKASLSLLLLVRIPKNPPPFPFLENGLLRTFAWMPTG